MKKLSIRLIITLWFGLVLVIITAAMSAAILYISSSVLKDTIRNELVLTVESNADEVAFRTVTSSHDTDQYVSGYRYLEYNGGYLEIDEDFLNCRNGVYCAVYSEDGVLIYGENPIAYSTAKLDYSDGSIRSVSYDGVIHFVYDKQLELSYGQVLWIRGTVSAESGSSQLSNIIRLTLLLIPTFVVIAIIGGYIIAGKALHPVKKIAEATAEIERGSDLKKRIEIGDGSDEIHMLADSVNSMISRLDKSFESEKRFSSDVSHELRTPVSVISAQCEYTLEKPRKTNEYEEALMVISRQTEKMSKMISDMLDFTRLETKSDRYGKTAVDFSELVKLTCMDFERIHSKNISLEYSIEDNIMTEGSYELLQRLVSNLVSNAFRYGKENGLVKVSLSADGKEACLCVSDNGIGIKTEDIDRIFDRFYQADSSRSSGGTGLGLAIAKEIAEFHGGRISVSSRLGEGSEFRFIMKAQKNH